MGAECEGYATAVGFCRQAARSVPKPHFHPKQSTASRFDLPHAHFRAKQPRFPPFDPTPPHQLRRHKAHGDPATSTSIGLTPYEAHRLGSTVQSYLSARETTHWRDQFRAHITTPDP